MAAKPVKIYPVRGRYLRDVPRAVILTESTAEAARLIETGAFTDNAHDPERDPDVVDLTEAPGTDEEGREIGTPTVAPGPYYPTEYVLVDGERVAPGDVPAPTPPVVPAAPPAAPATAPAPTTDTTAPTATTDAPTGDAAPKE